MIYKFSFSKSFNFSIKYGLLTIALHIFITSIGQEVSRPNILWISAEDISPAWGCYGDREATTPNIDAIADKGYVFTKAFSNAPICAPARSTLITGIYATSLGTQNLRSEIPIPKDLKILPELLSDNGYFTSNNAKTDYNFSAKGRWDDLGKQAHWRNRKDKRPFFSVFNFGITHEGHVNRYDPNDTKSLSEKHRPEEMEVPPHLPNTDDFKRIMAHQYDLITVFDQEVGRIVGELKADGLFENTIIFIFSDHGYGLPRYKRWLYHTGLNVPFVLHVPDRYKGLVSNLDTRKVDFNISFVDFAPTVLNLVGSNVGSMMQGTPFLGSSAKHKKYSFGYRDRADDAYDMSRSVFDGRFLYIRNYMPHLPYIQNVQIFGDQKWSYKELSVLKERNKLSQESMKMFLPKGAEELYDLDGDPNELTNLIGDKEYYDHVRKLRKELKKHLIDTRDTGFMNEGQMMLAGQGSSVYEVAQDNDTFNVQTAFAAAESVGKVTDMKTLSNMLQNDDPNVRYWALIAMQDPKLNICSQKSNLHKVLLNDASASNKFVAAELLINRCDAKERALAFFKNEIKAQQYEPVLLQLVIHIRNLGIEAKPLVPLLKKELYPKISGDVWGKYKDWNYPMFIGFALDQIFENCEGV